MAKMITAENFLFVPVPPTAGRLLKSIPQWTVTLNGIEIAEVVERPGGQLIPYRVTVSTLDSVFFSCRKEVMDYLLLVASI